VLVELGVVEQRYQAVREVLDGASVTEVARRYGIVRQTVHEWLRRYAGDGGLGGLADRSSRPLSCPHQMPAMVEAWTVPVRLSVLGWWRGRCTRRTGPANGPGKAAFDYCPSRVSPPRRAVVVGPHRTSPIRAAASRRSSGTTCW